MLSVMVRRLVLAIGSRKLSVSYFFKKSYRRNDAHYLLFTSPTDLDTDEYNLLQKKKKNSHLTVSSLHQPREAERGNKQTKNNAVNSHSPNFRPLLATILLRSSSVTYLTKSVP